MERERAFLIVRGVMVDVTGSSVGGEGREDIPLLPVDKAILDDGKL